MAFFTPPPPPLPIKPPIVTVWVHGTRPENNLPPYLGKLTGRLSALLSDTTKGLHKIPNNTADHYPSLRAKALAQADPEHFSLDHFYTFGWSGKASRLARQKAAHDLFYALKDLIELYQDYYGVPPIIILISHSHGGNVVLHLAEIADPDGFTLSISKAILLACPVQKHTAHLISSPMFERIYSLHSHTDLLQIIDPQGLHNPRKPSAPLLSLRHFDTHPKLSQALIRWKSCPHWHPDDFTLNKKTMWKLMKAINTINYIKKNRGLFHVEFGLLSFVHLLPDVINQLDALYDDNRNCPSHKDHDIIIEL
jgi:hypothetical protein